MKKISLTTLINAPRERVFGAVADPRKRFLTGNRITKMEVVGDRTAGVGTIYRWTFTLPLGLRFRFEEVVTEWLEPVHFAYRAISNWKMEAVTSLVPEESGTKVSFTLHYSMPGLWNWLVPKWLVRLGCQRAISNIQRMVDPGQRGEK